jgi:hypothetical protein
LLPNPISALRVTPITISPYKPITQTPVSSPWSPKNWNWGKIGAGALIGVGIIGVVACVATGQLELLPVAAAAF